MIIYMPCGADMSTFWSVLIKMTTDQKVAGSTPAGRAKIKASSIQY
jgi:hypothetical protein